MNFNRSTSPEMGEVEVVVEEGVPIVDFRLSATFHHAFASLDEVNLETEFRHRATVMRCPPKFLSGAYVSAMRVSMQEIRVGRAENNELRRIRGWKLFLMLPRMLLQKAGKGGLVPKSKLRERFAQFADGRWMGSIVSSREAAIAASNAKARRTRRCPDSLERRAERACAMAALGELSSARLSSEGEAIARGDGTTLAALRDRRRRPPEPREPILEEVLHHQPAAQVVFDNDWLLHNVRSSKKRSSSGPFRNDVRPHHAPLAQQLRQRVVLRVGAGGCQSRDSCRNCECHSSGKDDSFEETFRRGAWNCCGRRVAEVGGPYSRAGSGQQFQGQPPHHTNTPSPQGRLGPTGNVAVSGRSRNVRFDLQGRDDDSIA